MNVSRSNPSMNVCGNWRKPLRHRMNNRLTRLQNLESRVGADVVTFTFPNNATVAVNITRNEPFLVMFRLMHICGALYDGEREPDPSVRPLLGWTPGTEKIVALARRAVAISGRDAVWQATLHFA